MFNLCPFNNQTVVIVVEESKQLLYGDCSFTLFGPIMSPFNGGSERLQNCASYAALCQYTLNSYGLPKSCIIFSMYFTV